MTDLPQNEGSAFSVFALWARAWYPAAALLSAACWTDGIGGAVVVFLILLGGGGGVDLVGRAPDGRLKS